jgi:hypothetical protein
MSGRINEIRQISEVAAHCDEVDFSRNTGRHGILERGNGSGKRFVTSDRVVNFRTMGINAEDESPQTIIGQSAGCLQAHWIQIKIRHATSIERTMHAKRTGRSDDLSQVRYKQRFPTAEGDFLNAQTGRFA